MFRSVARVIVSLVISREGLRERLRPATPAGVPLLAEAGAMLESYLTAERELGRIASDADVDTIALTLIGTGYLLFAGRDATPDAEAVGRVVTSVIAGALAHTGR